MLEPTPERAAAAADKAETAERLVVSVIMAATAGAGFCRSPPGKRIMQETKNKFVRSLATLAACVLFCLLSSSCIQLPANTSGLLQTAAITQLNATITTSLATIASGGVSVTGGADLSVIATGTGTLFNAADSAVEIEVVLLLDGVAAHSGDVLLQPHGSAMFAVSFKAVLPAGPHTLDMKADARAGGAVGTATNCTLTALVVSI
jgi:hypothetical protein